MSSDMLDIQRKRAPLFPPSTTEPALFHASTLAIKLGQSFDLDQWQSIAPFFTLVKFASVCCEWAGCESRVHMLKKPRRPLAKKKTRNVAIALSRSRVVRRSPRTACLRLKCGHPYSICGKSGRGNRFSCVQLPTAKLRASRPPTDKTGLPTESTTSTDRRALQSSISFRMISAPCQRRESRVTHVRCFFFVMHPRGPLL
jgi:hypothetical protein